MARKKIGDYVLPVVFTPEQEAKIKRLYAEREEFKYRADVVRAAVDEFEKKE